MKKNVLWIVIVSVLMAAAGDARAETTKSKKLLRGVVNTITAPVEVPKQARAYWIEGAQKTDHILVWIGCGVAWGFVQSLKRMGSGLWDVVSFPVDKPENYEPLLKPDYVLQEWPRNPESGR